MDNWGLHPQDYVLDLYRLQWNGYFSYSALGILIYDSLSIIPREAQYMYCRKWSAIRVAYIAIRLGALMHSTAHIYTSQSDFLSRQWCNWGTFWLESMLIRVVLPGSLKALLFVRMRALWDQSVVVTTTLIFFLVVDMSMALTLEAINLYDGILYTSDPIPLHGCISTSSRFNSLLASLFVALAAVQIASVSIAAFLTLIKLVRTYLEIRPVGATFLERFFHFKSFLPVIYVFYRDGTLFFFPLLAVQVLGTVDLFNTDITGLALLHNINWTMWMATVYHFCGTRLLLNLCEANCKLTESLASQQVHSNLEFRSATCSESLGDRMTA